MEEIKVSEMLQADSISKNDSVMIIQGGVNKQAKGDTAEATGTSLSLSSVADTCKVKSNSKNLFNGNLSGTGNSVTYKLDGSELTYNGTTTTGYNIIDNTKLMTLSAGTYTISFTKLSGSFTVTGSTGNLTLASATSGGTLLSSTLEEIASGSSATITINETTDIYIRSYANTGITYSNLVVGIQLEEGSTATSYNPCNTEVFIGSENLKVSTNVVNGYLAGSNTILTGSANSRTTYIAVEPNTKYYMAKAIGNKFIIALSNATPTAGISVYNNIVYDGQKYAQIDSGTAKYLLITYWNINETITEEKAMASLIIAKDLQQLNLISGEEKSAFSYDTETSILANGSVTATYNKESRLLNNDDTTAIKEYVDRIAEDYIKDEHTYTTTGKRVGTWINGKPLYRIVYTSETYATSYSVPATDIDELVSISGIIHRKDYTSINAMIPSRTTNSQWYLEWGSIQKANNNTLTVNIAYGSTWGTTAFNDIKLIVEYTKTTD